MNEIRQPLVTSSFNDAANSMRGPSGAHRKVCRAQSLHPALVGNGVKESGFNVAQQQYNNNIAKQFSVTNDVTTSMHDNKMTSPNSLRVTMSQLSVDGSKLEKQDSSYFSDSEYCHSDVSRNISATSDSSIAISEPKLSDSGSIATVTSFSNADNSFFLPSKLQKQLSLSCGDHEEINFMSSPSGGATSTGMSMVQHQTNPGSTNEELIDCEGQEYVQAALYAVKLGYSEQKLRQVVSKLGYVPKSQDALIFELMKLGQDISSNAFDHKVVGQCQSLPAPFTTSNAILPAVALTDARNNCNTQWSHSTTGLSSSTPRSVVIDGSNVALTFGHNQVFAFLGIRECVKYFFDRGHNDVLVFIPQFRKEESRADMPSTDRHVIDELEESNLIVWTPSRRGVGNRRIVCYDDRYILKTAVEKDAVVVSNDEYRDLQSENPEFVKCVQERLLMYSFVDGKFCPPDDPLGKYGPSLDLFLRKPISVSSSSSNMSPTNAPTNCTSASSNTIPCPYGRRCTYGNKCKYYHAERVGGIHRSVTERIMHHAAQEHKKLSPANSLDSKSRYITPWPTPASSIATGSTPGRHRIAERTQSLIPFAVRTDRQQGAAMNGHYDLRNHSSPKHTHGNFVEHEEESLVNNVTHVNSFVENPQQHLQFPHQGISKQSSNPERVLLRSNGIQRNLSLTPDAAWLQQQTSDMSGLGVSGGYNCQVTNVCSAQQSFWDDSCPLDCLGPTPVSSNHRAISRYCSTPVWPASDPQLGFNSDFPTNAQNVVDSYGYAAQQTVNNYHRSSNSESNLLKNNRTLDTILQSPLPTSTTSGSDGSSNDQGMFFVASSTLWGPLENSTQPPVSTTTLSGQLNDMTVPSQQGDLFHSFEDKSRFYYHMSSIFGEQVVREVMNTHPQVNDPRQLGSMICDAARSRSLPSSTNNHTFANATSSAATTNTTAISTTSSTTNA